MPKFGQIIEALSALNETLPEMEWRITSDGLLKVDAYVGIENHDLYKQAMEMFAPSE